MLTAAASGLTAVCAAAFSESEAEAEELQCFTQSLQTAAATDSQSGTISAAVFDWNNEFAGSAKFDVVIACDVLYEEVAVEPLARLLPAMLAGPVEDGRRILLTDPQDRTPKHRERFLELLAHTDPSLVVDFVKTVEVEQLATGATVKVLSMPLLHTTTLYRAAFAAGAVCLQVSL